MHLSMSISGAAARFAAVSLLVSSTHLAHAAPAALSESSSAPLGARAAAISFSESCTDIAYFGYCRVEATCTLDGSAVSTGADTQHTILDLARCISYNTKTQELVWRSSSVSRWHTGYCEPCDQCTIDPDTTEMTCDCEYPYQSDHETQLLLSDHVYNQGGLLSCLNVQGDADPNYSPPTTKVETD